MESQRFAILGRVWSDDDPQWQGVLARVHESSERPRCLCVPGGIEMYVAQHRQFVVKRMPDTGSLHHPGCPSYGCLRSSPAWVNCWARRCSNRGLVQ